MEQKSETLYIYDDESYGSYLDDGRDLGPYEKVNEEKKLIAAVVENNAEALKRLLNSPKLYYVVDKDGFSLLQIAVELDSRKCFDYLLSLPDFPLNIPGNDGQTALFSAIKNIGSMCWNSEDLFDDRLALELIKMGADTFCIDHLGRTTLIYAAFQKHVKMAEIFIENGVDLNVQDCDKETALHVALSYEESDTFEFGSLLLYKGADPRLQDENGLIPFEVASLHCNDPILHEILFNYTYDDYSEMKTYPSVLLKLAKHKSFLLNFFEDVHEVDCTAICCNTDIFSIEEEFLSVLLKKFNPDFLRLVLKESSLLQSEDTFCFGKIELLLDSDIREDMIARTRL